MDAPAPTRSRTAGVLAMSVLLLGVGCSGQATAPANDSGSRPTAGPPQPAGHQRMIALLRDVARAALVDNPCFGQSVAREQRALLAALPEDAPVPQRWQLNLLLGMQELRLGNEELSIEYYEEAYRLLGQSADPVPPATFVRTAFESGVAYLHHGRTVNAIAAHGSASSAFPIEPAGVQRFGDATRAAIQSLTEVLQVAPAGSAEALRARWLLNVAYMRLGGYPQQVPAELRIPLERFGAAEPFPRFPEIAGRIGLDLFNHAGGVVAEDLDGDERLDLLISSSNPEGQLRYFVNAGDGTFVERTVPAGLLGLMGGLTLVPADYDNDGHVDFLVLRGGNWRQFGRHPRSLVHNNGDGTFTDVTFDSGLGEPFQPAQSAAWADYDNDGDLDLYVGNQSDLDATVPRHDDAPVASVRAPGQLFRNDGAGTFSDVASAAGVENLRYAASVAWGDYDGDRWPDLYVSNLGEANRLYHNDGDGTFTDVAGAAGVDGPTASSAAWFWDVDNDGALDLYVAGYGADRTAVDVASLAADYLGGPAHAERARLYLGDGRGGFRDAAAEWKLTRVTFPLGTAFGDLDNDGFLDFFLGQGYPRAEGRMPTVVYHNQRGRRFVEVTTAGGFGQLQKGQAVVFADLDNDGDQEVYEQAGGAWRGDADRNLLFDNPGSGHHWIKIRLRGTRSNRPGLGARIRLEIVERGERRTIYSSLGSLSRRELGLGEAERIERLEVFWPTSDTTQELADVPADRMVEITEGQEGYRELPLR